MKWVQIPVAKEASLNINVIERYKVPEVRRGIIWGENM